jgi:tetratricopeptide (TPR) repeat protein
MQQAFLYGMAASGGDADAAQKAIAAYRRFLEMEPYHAASWANLGALYWQLDQEAEAIAAMKRAVELAPHSWQLAFNLGDFAEQR